MHQRLLLTLSFLVITAAAMAQNVMTPTDGDYIYNSAAAAGSLTNPTAAGAGIIQQWVHDPNQPDKIGRITWNQTNYKSYRLNTTSYRLRFPNNYDPSKKYPCVVFLHGAGEAANNTNAHNSPTIDRENQDQLFWGGSLFDQRINSGEWNGFLLFPQLLANSAGAGSQWDNSTFPTINSILDALTTYNGLDPDRVVAMGLSAGGVGSITYASLYPMRIATVVSSSPKLIESLVTSPASTENLAQIPIWMASGGTDSYPSGGPDPANAFKSYDSIVAHGTNIYYSYYPTKSHDTWETQWLEKDVNNKMMLSIYWNAASKAQPLVYGKNTQFCTSSPISAKLALTPGFAAYEWQINTGGGFTTIPGATSYVYTATQAGQYQVHFKRTLSADWSAWTPAPIVISTKICAPSSDTAYVEHFDEIPISYIARDGGGGNSSYRYQNFNCQNGIFPNSSEDFTQDAQGRQGGSFMLNSTLGTGLDGTSCSYGAGDQVWHNLATVLPNTNYTFSFSMGNQFNYYPPYTSTGPAALSVIINGTTLTPTGGVGTPNTAYGNASWKKYSYTWNSGNAPNNTADIGIVNNTLNSAFNDFTLDEISLVKYKTPVMPGAVTKNVDLWVKANSISGSDNSAITVWPNNDVNGNNFSQPDSSTTPFLKNNAADNINFNPVASFKSGNGNASNLAMRVGAGLSGTATHTAATAFMVAKFSDLSQNYLNVLIEQETTPGSSTSTGGAAAIMLVNPGIIQWWAGPTSATALQTPANTNELNKPILWSFSKDDIHNTPNNNKQDIRKNGVVVASSNITGAFTGFQNMYNYPSMGAFNGSLAEIIYLLDSTITPLSQNKVESYLALKYGTTLGNVTTPNNYTASDGTTVFWTGNATYQNDVFGIGTDSASGLVQAKSNSVNSGSGDGTGQSAKGNLVLATNTTLLDKRFLMIGNDAASLSQHVIANGEAATIAVGSTRVIRNWKVSNTGTVGAVDLSFDTTGLGNQQGMALPSNYAVMIDNDGDGNYNTGTLSFFTATGAAGTKINFSGLTLNNGVVFTLITFKLSAALPATWLGFTAVAVNGNALLNWKTSDEINVDSYTAEHSFNGVSFAAVGSVTANNNTGVNNYSFTNTGLAPGIHYYRIRRTDKDGKVEYSDIKSVKISTTGANVQVRPNPVTGSTLVLGVSVQQSSKTNVQVMGVDGKIIVRENINLAAGNNIVNINISTVPPGIYLVQIQLTDEVVTKKFIKER